MIIAIDGPAASGKSTTARLIANRLDLLYLDTGAMYRAVALYMFERGIDTQDGEALQKNLADIDISFKDSLIFLNNEDVSEKIREPHISKLSSQIAIIKIVRHKMVELQREIAKGRDVILEGRDIGTVVFPDADYKFFLTASLESRAERRYKEMSEKGIELTLEQIQQELQWRDQNDTQRAEAPLRKADDAIEIDTTLLTIEEQVHTILAIVNRTNKG